ncbi:MAG TPA: tRNA (adenosine(37)-N6)-dimethylallyltransferase MiaA, partial [Verrucomicrobiae bacterium]|nr:tRNA (adenosine(37)-N6)-dimethylallyltransferase MiaA [Verrucomicrobiae bacterium]
MASAAPLQVRTSEPPLLLLAGPTAVGKTEIALRLADRLNGEIVSVDSMQIYRGLDIGTAKPSHAERALVPHHLIDILELQEGFDANRFVQLATAVIAEIRSRARLPILCGGTGLYFKAFLEGLGHSPPGDPALRKQLEQIPLAELLAELKEKDPASFDRIDRQNPRRVIRAVEVIRLTGRPFSEQRARWGSEPPKNAGCKAPAVLYALTRS